MVRPRCLRRAAQASFSLTLEKFSAVVSAAASETAGRAPVLAGCGYGTQTAKQFARAAEEAGADGLLLLPPYLVNAEPAGLIAHAEADLRFHEAGRHLL